MLPITTKVYSNHLALPRSVVRPRIVSQTTRRSGWLLPSARGAIAIYDGPGDLLARIDESALGGERSQRCAARRRDWNEEQ